MQHPGVRGAGWDDWPDVRLRLDHKIDQYRSPNRSRPFNCRTDLRIGADGDAGDAVRLGELLEVRRADLDLGVILGVDQVLPLADHPEIAVVDDRDIDIELLLHHSRELVAGHLKTAVTDYRPDLQIGPANLGSDGRRQAKAHGAETPRRDPAIRVVETEVLGGPHLMLPDVGREDRLTICRLR